MPAPRALTFSQVLGKAAAYTCLLLLNLTPVTISHGSSSLLGAMTADSCWVYGKGSVPEVLPCSFRPEVPKQSTWHSESDSKAEYPDSIQAMLQLLQVSNALTLTWHLMCSLRPRAFGPSLAPASSKPVHKAQPWLIFGRTRFGTHFRITDLHHLRPPNLCYRNASQPQVLPCLIPI